MPDSARVRLAVGLAAVAAAGAVAFVLATRWGPGISPDGVVYVEAARHLAAGDGLSTIGHDGRLEPMTHFPPLFPTVLAGLSALGLDPLEGARVLNGTLLALNGVLVGILVRCALPSSIAGPVVAALLFTLNTQMLSIHVRVLSEPLFLFLGAAALGLLGLALDGRRPGLRIGAAILVGLAIVDRYAGVALLVSGAITWVALGGGSLRWRLARAAEFAAIGSLPLLGWLVLRRGAEAGPVGHAFVFHPIEVDRIAQGVDTISSWFLLHAVPTVWSGVLLVALAGGLAFLGLRPAEGGRVAGLRRRLGPVAAVFAIFAGVYGLFLAFSISFVDASTKLNYRILSPLFIALLLVVMRAARPLLRPAATPALRAIGVGLAAVFVGSYALFASEWVRDSRETGIWPGFGTREWRESPALHALAGVDDGVRLYSNGPDAIRVLVDRPALLLPRRVDPVSGLPPEDLEQRVRSLLRDVARDGALVVWLDRINWRTYLLSPDDLRGMGLIERERLPDGTIYGAPNR